MRDNSFDKTIERNYIQKWRFLIAEHEAVKDGRSNTFKRVGEFYRHHGTCSQTFRKYYNRYLAEGGAEPYRPQTNGKVERFWRTLDADVIEGATFDDPANLASEILEYMLYYNELRPHQALGGQTPKVAAEAAGHI